MDVQDDFLTVKQASALLGVKPATLYAYVSRGVLKSFRLGVGRQRLYRRADIEALMEIRADHPSPQQVAEEPAVYQPAPAANDDRTLRDVCLPNAETWAGDH
ncbi:MAG: helix-turn-helix domain-containing protein [Oscillochloris sp.]|nr:helix-turn-helix domain-containing protein [Oscillochloris sp.]